MFMFFPLKDVKQWPDWKRVLLAWRKRGHTGLTIQSLAEVTGLKQDQLWEEVRKDKHAYLQYCSLIQAPVVSIYSEVSRRKIEKHHPSYGYTFVVYGEIDGWKVYSKTHQGAKKTKKYLTNLVEAFMKLYPHEDGFLGVQDCKGIRTLHRMEKHEAFLRAVAAGKAEPHESNKKGVSA